MRQPGTQDVPGRASGTGDRPISTRRATSGRVVGIDVGGSGIKGAPVDLSVGRFATDRVRLPTPRPATPDRVADVVAEVLDHLDVAGPVGVTLPAVVADGVVETAANIDPSWLGVHAVELFGRATGRPVGVLNDADAAGIAEMRYGAGKGRGGVVVVVTLGTGIGTAVFSDGVLVPNTELGHLPLHHGDAEDWVAESVREREDLSWKHYAHRLQHYLELVQRLLWPRLIVIGGGVSRKAEKFLPHIELRTEVVPARLHNDAGIVGAALFAPLSLGRPAAVPAP
ncbi:polyphosphate--glucose phosphotransferase [Gandjariella thermophila]|uniref:Polyphosphate glucokinase n=1 Tax=Gandjariella thermophila TaxID=1931992 RepID=A0A4D4JCX7_9PSEU|nr:ROK family protein [Gandjariella thermophila]GDY32860.1 polyphosphate glucokinase [Gandjariella thermophila]